MEAVFSAPQIAPINSFVAQVVNQALVAVGGEASRNTVAQRQEDHNQSRHGACHSTRHSRGEKQHGIIGIIRTRNAAVAAAWITLWAQTMHILTVSGELMGAF